MLLLALLAVGLAVSGCALLSPEIPTPSPPSSSTEHVDPAWTFPAAEQPAAAPLPNFPPVIAKVMPSVVSVTTEMVVTSLFGQYTQAGAGSGVIIDEAGYIVTNNHVVNNAESVQVELIDGRSFPAQLVGTDPLSDCAVLKIEAPDLSHAHWGDSSGLSIGDWVIAIGNALGEGITATEGIVSRLDVSINVGGNTLYGLIQTTAAINQGNSGGPLVNMAGEVIGITSVKMAAIGVEGMAYAIGSNGVRPIIEDLIHEGYIPRPWLGVALYPVDASVAAAKNLSVKEGALIVQVVPDSPADRAGLKEDDVIVRFGGKKVATVEDLINAIHDSQPGEAVEIDFVRGDETRTTTAELVESPPPQG